MNKPKLYVHGSYIGTTGYNNHTRDFFRKLSNHIQLKIRNFTVGSANMLSYLWNYCHIHRVPMAPARWVVPHTI